MAGREAIAILTKVEGHVKQVAIQREGASMRYRHVIQVSMAMAMLTSGAISAQAVFPETEFSEGAPEPRRALREIPHNKPALREDHPELRDEHRDPPRNTQDNRTDRQELRQDESAVHHDRQQPRLGEAGTSKAGQIHQGQQQLRQDRLNLSPDRRDLKADRQHRRGGRHKANKNRRKLHHEQRDLQAGHRSHREGPPRPIEQDR